MTRKALVGIAVSVCMALAAAAAPAAPPDFQPGAPGAGDPYFPLDGNGGYDAKHYLLDVAYDPSTDVLTGKARIRARATQDLSSFNLDFSGLEVRSITVDGRRATWTRDGQELVVTPRHGIRRGRTFRTIVRYDGVPETIEDAFGLSGFLHTDDGAVIVGQPHVAATWYPVNDHPSDKAAYTFRVTVPEGLEAVANGILEGQKTYGGRTTWIWDAKEPMASYLTTATVGEFDLRAYAADGILYWDALDPDLFDPIAAPRTGEQFAFSQVGNSSYKRLTRTISVPAGGAELSFWMQRLTEPGWDFVFVEARTAGSENWTTLPDRNGHTSDDTGASCPGWHDLHPFLTHYQGVDDAGACVAEGSSGTWSAASGPSAGYEQWSVDLSAYAGSDVEVSISYATDDVAHFQGVAVDDIVVSTGEGTTSFEDDGDALDGWTAAGAPAGSPANANDWIAATVADAPPSIGAIAEGSLARQPEIIAFLEESFGPYPFSAAGGIVDDLPTLGFALENQTRPIYSMLFFDTPESGDDVVVHELAHQWYGDSLALARWQHIWLNEGFATYAEWLWSEREERGTAQEVFDFFYNGFPPEDPFWQLRVGDPGPDHLFDAAVYYRGAMTLHQLRLQIGDEAFFRLLREWAQSREGGNVTTDEFIALAEQISGMQLDALFETWLFTPGRPVLPVPVAAAGAASQSGPAVARNQLRRLARR